MRDRSDKYTVRENQVGGSSHFFNGQKRERRSSIRFILKTRPFQTMLVLGNTIHVDDHEERA